MVELDQNRKTIIVPTAGSSSMIITPLDGMTNSSESIEAGADAFAELIMDYIGCSRFRERLALKLNEKGYHSIPMPKTATVKIEIGNEEYSGTVLKEDF